MILAQALEKHRKMIKTLRGVPGVLPERFEEAKRIKHCALSLVGEPIMYPHIDRYVRLLHEEKISTFLVTNAQFPDRIVELGPVTQLYVSVDAATPETLKAIDRPLFNDYWPRFLASLKHLKRKKIRTVFRLTLVKGHNTSDLPDYARLILLGLPGFIEIKGVTFCGKANDSYMSMSNVPFHVEVRQFAEDLCALLGGSYSMATEHAHSLCVLIAHNKFRTNGQWNTHIDYDKFHELVANYYETGQTFDDVDYAAPTPSWALYNSPEQGFNPAETRWRKQRKHKVGSKRPANADNVSLATKIPDEKVTAFDEKTPVPLALAPMQTHQSDCGSVTGSCCAGQQSGCRSAEGSCACANTPASGCCKTIGEAE
jgi:tRNA wybutosine-synthesizing protein 1